MLGSRASRGSPFFSLGYKSLHIADWCKSARNWVRAEGRAWLDSQRDISFQSMKRSRAPWICQARRSLPWLFLFVPIPKIAPSPFVFAPFYGQLRDWNWWLGSVPISRFFYEICVLMAYGRCLRPALYSSLRSSPSHPTGVSALRVTIAIARERKEKKQRERGQDKSTGAKGRL